MCILITTYGSEDEAAYAAKAMVEKRLAACSTFFRVRSVYEWEGRVEDAAEYMVIFKTSASKADELKHEILKTHSYKVPELLVIQVDSVSEEYLRWMLDSLNRDSKMQQSYNTA